MTVHTPYVPTKLRNKDPKNTWDDLISYASTMVTAVFDAVGQLNFYSLVGWYESDFSMYFTMNWELGDECLMRKGKELKQKLEVSCSSETRDALFPNKYTQATTVDATSVPHDQQVIWRKISSLKLDLCNFTNLS